MSVTYTAVLPFAETTVTFLAGLLDDERLRRGTRARRRALTTRDQAILVLRWFVDGTRVKQLARADGGRRPVVVGKTSPSRRQRAGGDRARRVAPVDLARATGPRT